MRLVEVAPEEGRLKQHRWRGMVFGMATRKITVTLNEDQLARIRGLIESGKARSVSGLPSVNGGNCAGAS